MTDAEIQEMNWPEVIESAREKFVQVMPKGMAFDSERAFAIQALKNNDFLMKIARANPVSLQSAVFNIAAVGLSLNPAKHQAYLVPRKGKVCFDVSYSGMMDLATMSGSVQWMQAFCVYATDTFEPPLVGDRPIHKYNPFATKADRGPLVGVYSVAKTSHGDYLWCPMPKEEIDAIRGRSEAAKQGGGPWFTDYEEMAKKSVIRRHFKTLPKTESLDRLALAVQLSNEAEDFEPIKTSPPIETYSDDQKKVFDQLITTANKVEMFLFARSIPEGAWNSLYNSFEKGKITKYKQIVDSLYNEGSAQLRAIAEKIEEHAGNSDVFAISEELAGLSEDAVAFITEQVRGEAPRMIREAQVQSQEGK